MVVLLVVVPGGFGRIKKVLVVVLGGSRWHSEFLELVLVVVLLVVLAVVLGIFGLNKKVLVVVLGVLDDTRRLWCWF